MTILNGCLGYMPTPESHGRGPAMIMGSTAMHDSAPIDDTLFIMLLLLRYYLLLFFVGRKLFSPFLTKFLQVSGRSNLKMSPGAYDSVYQKRTWRIRCNLSWAPLVPIVLSIKGAKMLYKE